MKSFKFLSSRNRGIHSSNELFGFDMDEALMSVIKYKQQHNQQILNWKTSLHGVNVPIDNAYIEITHWETILPSPEPGEDYILFYKPEVLHIHYKVEDTIRTYSHNFIMKIDQPEFLTRLGVEVN